MWLSIVSEHFGYNARRGIIGTLVVERHRLSAEGGCISHTRTFFILSRNVGHNRSREVTTSETVLMTVGGSAFASTSSSTAHSLLPNTARSDSSMMTISWLGFAEAEAGRKAPTKQGSIVEASELI
jgi:hypothetical protein